MRLKDLLFYISISLIFALHDACAERFILDDPSNDLVGGIEYIKARGEDTLVDIAREFNLGYDQIVNVNPEVNRWVPGAGTVIVLPHYYILPGAVRKGIVLNIAELRLYYYPKMPKGAAAEVITHPVSIGRMDWKTPLGATKVIKKDEDPPWRPPASIRAEHLRDGDPLPEVIPGGAPDNPLGHFAMRLGFPGYLIHGVDERKAYGIGMRVTHGCIRMYPEDIESIYPTVPLNTPVFIMNEPIKIGRRGSEIYIEVHQPLDEREDESLPELPRVTTSEVLNYISSKLDQSIEIDPELIAQITDKGDGIPHLIARSSLQIRDQAKIPAPPAKKETVKLKGPAQKKKNSLDDAYEEALGKYIGDDDQGGEYREPIPESDRRPGAPRQDQNEVMDYLDSRY